MRTFLLTEEQLTDALLSYWFSGPPASLTQARAHLARQLDGAWRAELVPASAVVELTPESKR